MDKARTFLLGLFLVLLAVDCFGAGSEENVGVNTGVNPQLKDKNNLKEKSSSDSDTVSSSTQVNAESEKGGDQGNKPKDGNVDDWKNSINLSSQSVFKGTDNLGKGKGDSSGEVPVKDGNDKKENNLDGGSKSKAFPQEKGNGEGKVDPLNQRKESLSVEECDTSNKCTDEENKLVACLRVPGDEYPEFSLFIQNKVDDPLDIAISAPNFLQLEESIVQLAGKQNKEVKVSIINGVSRSQIVLKAGNGHCNLDVKDFIEHKFGKEHDNSHKSSSINFMTRSPTLVFLSFVVVLIVASGWMCISFCKKLRSSNASKYQRLDMELPVAGGGKTLSEINEGWDNNWGDDWDDEEAPKTPSLAVTPSLSSKGLASRWVSKYAWKD